MNFDKEIANKIIGKYILVGITYLDSNGEIESQQQLHGKVKFISEKTGILIELGGVHAGEDWNMPPDTSGIREASPGRYNISSTDEVVENPDFTCTWEVHSPKRNET